jgi:ubiquinol-cytochrome c reductase cytochrome b subunit
LGDWLDERTGHRELLDEILDAPIVGGARWAYVFGSALAVIFAVEAATGLLLVTTYAPSAQTAWASVHYITFGLSGGWLVRGLHHFGSQAMIVLVALHLLQVVLFGAYKKPREVTWWFGLALFAAVMGFALTGHFLPWDQKGYWAARVETSILGTTPLVGPWLQTLIQGGHEYGNLTLTRMYALHVGLLPAALVVLLAVHVALVRKHGVTPSARADRTKVDPFYPNQMAMDVAAGLFVLVVLFALALHAHGAPLDAPADPASDYPAHPEWFFLWLFQLRKALEGPREILATMVLPGVVVAFLVALPLLDRAASTALRPRLGYVGAVFAGFVAVLGLTFAAVDHDAHDGAYQALRKRADARAAIAVQVAKQGIPPGGPLELLRHDPELRGEDLYAKECASCHVLGDLGDKEKATAPILDGWGTEAWIVAMIHDPDDRKFFGNTPYKGEMPSVDVPPKNRKPSDAAFKPMSQDDMRAVAAFLASQGDDEHKGTEGSDKQRAQGEAIVADRCTTCHLYKGDGDVGSTETAPELSHYGSIAWVKAQIANPATPTTYRADAVDTSLKGHMPRFETELTPEDLDILARYTRAHARGVPLAAPIAQAPEH